MQFDHTKGVKHYSISQALHYSQATLLAEIAKCDLVCANCHAVRTKLRTFAQIKQPKPQLLHHRNKLKAPLRKFEGIKNPKRVVSARKAYAQHDRKGLQLHNRIKSAKSSSRL
jgi:hypothetical protein